MQQPETSKNCPICRAPIDGKPKDKKKEEPAPEAQNRVSDEDRRSQRLIRHNFTLKKMRVEFCERIINIALNSEAFHAEDRRTTETIIETNLDQIILYGINKEKNELVLERHTGFPDINDQQLRDLGNEIKEALRSSKNHEADFCFPSVYSAGGTTRSSEVKEVRKLKMDMLVQLYRIYRSRKHLNFTATRSYFSMSKDNFGLFT